MVPTAVPSAMVALVAPLRVTAKVSVGSAVVSPVTGMLTVCGAVELAGKVTVPLPAV